MSAEFTLPTNFRQQAYQYRPCYKEVDHVPELSIKATILVFDDDDLIGEEHETFSDQAELNKFAYERAAYEAAHGRRIKVIWRESLVSSGSIVFL